MAYPYDFDTAVDRRGTWSVQWDGVADRFPVPGLLPFTISDMDFPVAPAVRDALLRRVGHGVFGYTDWRNDDFLGAVTDWFARRHGTRIDPGSLVYAPSVLSQVSQLLRMWTEPGDGVVVHTPVYDGFRKAVEGLGRELRGVGVRDWEALERELARPGARVLLLCSPHNPTGTVWTDAELTRTAALADRYGIPVISDEIHADLTHEGHVHRPWTHYGRGRWALVTSGSKAFNFPALTGSYGVIGDPADRTEFLRRTENGEGLASPAVLSLTAHIAAYRESMRLARRGPRVHVRQSAARRGTAGRGTALTGVAGAGRGVPRLDRSAAPRADRRRRAATGAGRAGAGRGDARRDVRGARVPAAERGLPPEQGADRDRRGRPGGAQAHRTVTDRGASPPPGPG